MIEETQTTKEYFAKFLYNGLNVSTINDYNVVKNHFQNFKIDREFDYFLNDVADFSVSGLRLFLYNSESVDINNYVNLFSITIESSPGFEPVYRYFFREDEDYFNEQLDNSFNEIRIEMRTTFYLNLVDLNNLDDEDEDEDEEILPPTQNVFEDDNCLVCLENKPNIIFNPCNHFVICEKCDEKGKFINCVKCREKICNKLKIKKDKTIYADQSTQTDKTIYSVQSTQTDKTIYTDQSAQTDKIIYANKSVGTNDYEKTKNEKPNSIEDQIKIIEEKLEKLELKNQFLENNLLYRKEKEDIYECDLEELKNGYQIGTERKVKKKNFFPSTYSDKTIKREKETIKDFLTKLLREVDNM